MFVYKEGRTFENSENFSKFVLYSIVAYIYMLFGLMDATKQWVFICTFSII